MSVQNLSPVCAELLDHLRRHAVRRGERFVLRSGAESDWYVDARQTTFDGPGAVLVGRAVLEVLGPEVQAVGGMTMGADPIAVATAITAAGRGRPLRAFSIRKTAKGHGVGGRLVGPVRAGDKVVILEDTTTTGGAIVESLDVAAGCELEVVQVVSIVDRSDGAVASRLRERGIPYEPLFEADRLAPG